VIELYVICFIFVTDNNMRSMTIIVVIKMKMQHLEELSNC